jgi:hypothetical protein
VPAVGTTFLLLPGEHAVLDVNMQTGPYPCTWQHIWAAKQHADGAVSHLLAVPQLWVLPQAIQGGQPQ